MRREERPIRASRGPSRASLSDPALPWHPRDAPAGACEGCAWWESRAGDKGRATWWAWEPHERAAWLSGGGAAVSGECTVAPVCAGILAHASPPSPRSPPSPPPPPPLQLLGNAALSLCPTPATCSLQWRRPHCARTVQSTPPTTHQKKKHKPPTHLLVLSLLPSLFFSIADFTALLPTPSPSRPPPHFLNHCSPCS